MTKVIRLDDIEEPAEPQNLRLLRRLVTVLTIVMIVGFIIMITALVIRLQRPAAPTLGGLPPEITLPGGAAPLAFTKGPDWIAITTQDQILIYAPDGSLRQTVDIKY